MWTLAVEAHRAGDADTARAGFAAAHEGFRLALAHHPGHYTKEAAYGEVVSKWNELGMMVGANPSTFLEQPRATQKQEPRRGEPQFPRSEYTAEELELLATYDDYQAHVDDPSDKGLQQVLYHRTRLAMNHNRFDEAEASARALLEGSDGTELHAWAAAMLTDVLTVAWVDKTSTPRARESAGQRLDEWLTHVETMQLYWLEESEPLRAAIPTLRAGIAATRG